MNAAVKILVFLMCVTVVMTDDAVAGIFDTPLAEGNKLNKEGRYEEAIKKYEEAIKKTPDLDVLNYNAGTAYYNTGDYQKALESFTKSMSTKDPSIEKRSNYNAGDTLYMTGKSLEDKDPSAAMSSYENALQYFKRALELDDSDADARRNYELTKKKITQMKDRPKPQKNDKKEDKKDDKKDKDNDKNKEDKKDGSDKDKDKDKDNDKDERGHDKPNRPSPSPSPDKIPELKGPKPPSMTKEEADRLLEGLKQDNVPRAAIDDKGKKGGYPNVQKDW